MATGWTEDVDLDEERLHEEEEEGKSAETTTGDEKPAEQSDGPDNEAPLDYKQLWQQANEVDDEVRRIMEAHGLGDDESAPSSDHLEAHACESDGKDDDVAADERPLSREISEESLDFFQKFSSIRERADRPRDVQRRKRAAIDSLIEACEAMNVCQVYAEYPARTDKAIHATDDGQQEQTTDDLTPQPAPRSRPRSRVSTPSSQVGWIWGPELTTGPQAENVYVEVLYSLIHAIGRADSASSADVVNYLKQLFQFTDAKHDELLSCVSERTPPEVALTLGVIQGRKLKGKDVNGMSDPYCSIWISSNRQKFQDTTMKPRTLDPVWNETLTFSIKDANEDVLHLEVWDYDPDETVKEKMGRISEVKDLRGMGILLKQIANASKAPGKPNHGFIGQLSVPLKLIPLAGIERWYPLEGRDKSRAKERGDVRLSLSLSAVRTEAQFTLQDSFVHYEHMFRIIVEHEMRADAEWRGRIPDTATALLRQFAAHRGLRQSVVDDCMWSVYASVLSKRTLDFVLLLNLVQRLRKAMADDKLVEEELVTVFWSAAETFATAALSVVRYLRNHAEVCSDSAQLSALLECLKELQTMAPQRLGFSNMLERIADAVTMGAADRWSRAFGGRKQGGPICDDDRMENAIRICQLLMADLKMVLTSHQEIFLRHWQVSPFSVAYLFYDGQLCGLTKPVVDSVSRSLKSVHISEDEMISLALEASGAPPVNQDCATPNLTIGTALFELYVSIQQFHKLSIALPEQQREQVKLAGFYGWFSQAVSRWLDIAVFKALMRIGKAVNLDNFQTVDSMVKYSSSAVDTVTVYYQIKTFWDQLSWPDLEGALAFVIKIMDDVNRCSSFYVEAIRLKLDRLFSMPPLVNQPFAISTKICAAINSILHVRQSINQLANDLGLDSLCNEIKRNNNDTIHHKTVEALTENALDNINSKLDEIFYTLARRFETEIAKHINAVVTSDFNTRSIDKLNSYICDQLCTLNAHIETDVFMRMLNIFHRHILQNFLDVLQGEVEKKRQPACFRRWEELLGVIDHCFHVPDAEEDTGDEIMDKIRWLLKLHGADTTELIHQYRLERMKESERDEGLGSITVRAVFIDDNLNVDVLNARNLKAMDRGGAADPYVKIQLLPSHHFPDAAILKTKVQKNTLFPLFDDSFTYPVPKEFQTMPECYVLFVVKDKDLIGTNEFMGEAFLGFQQITRGDSSIEMSELEQIILPLTKPPEKESEYLEVLEGRAWDKTARDFARKEKKRMGANK